MLSVLTLPVPAMVPALVTVVGPASVPFTTMVPALIVALVTETVRPAAMVATSAVVLLRLPEPRFTSAVPAVRL
jgi:hypothetical protein